MQDKVQVSTERMLLYSQMQNTVYLKLTGRHLEFRVTPRVISCVTRYTFRKIITPSFSIGLREDGFGPDKFFNCIVAEAKIKEGNYRPHPKDGGR